jgi:asparagine N-glycosylation enzyme membrane subunit Stt3
VRTSAWREIGQWVAAAIGIAIEFGLIWLFDRLPTWAQIVVCVIPAVLAVIGTVSIIRTRSVLKRR